MALSKSLDVKSLDVTQTLIRLGDALRENDEYLIDKYGELDKAFNVIDRNKLDPNTKSHIINYLSKCCQEADSIKGRAEKFVNEITQRLETLGNGSVNVEGFRAKTDSTCIASPVDDVTDDAMRLQLGNYQREPHGRIKVRRSSDSGILSTGSTISTPSLTESQITDNLDRATNYLNRSETSEEASIEDNARVEVPSVLRDSVAFAQGFEPFDQDFFNLQGKLTNENRAQKCASKISRDSSLDQ